MEDDGSFISPDEVTTRDIEFQFRIFSKRLDGDSEVWDVEVGSMQTFMVNYHPGAPKYIAQISPSPDNDIELTNGDVAPPIVIACYDAFGNRTAPHQGVRWSLNMEVDGPMKSESDTPESYCITVLPSGDATISHFTVKSSESNDQPEGSIVSHTVQLDAPHYIDNQDPAPSLQIKFKVKPSHYPTTLQVLHEGKPIPTPWILPTGFKIQNLTYRVLDEEGEEIALSGLECQKSKTSGLLASWSSTTQKVRNRKVPLVANLPDILIPEILPLEVMEFSIELKLDKENLDFQFDIEVVPAKPAAWKILSAPNIVEGIISGCSIDFLSKIRGVCLVDAFGNMLDIDVEETENLQIPIMTASYQRPLVGVANMTQSNGHMDIDNENHHDNNNNSSSSNSSSSSSSSSNNTPKKQEKRKRGKDKVNDCQFISILCIDNQYSMISCSILFYSILFCEVFY